jgi:hypothetical protein
MSEIGQPGKSYNCGPQRAAGADTEVTKGPLPFIVSTSLHDAQDPERQRFIRRHVMLGKNRGKTRRYKDERVPACDRRGEAFEKREFSAQCPRPLGLERPTSTLSLIQFADAIGVQMLGDVMDCKPRPYAGHPDTSLELTSHHLVAVNAKSLLFPLGSCILFDKNDRSWFQPLFFDALYLHSIAFSAHTYLQFLFSRRSPERAREAEIHFAKTVSLLRKRLLAQSEKAVSDVTIMVVLSLSTIAIMNQNFRSAEHHLQGLRKLITLKGGLVSLTRPKFVIETFRHGFSPMPASAVHHY